MLVHCDPFAHYATAQVNDVYANGPGGAAVTIGAFGPSGRPSIRFTGDLDDSLVRTVTTSGAVCIFQADFRISAYPASTNVIFAPLLSAAVQCSLDLKSTGKLAVHRGFAGTKTQLGSDSTYVVPLDTHIHIEVMFTIADGTSGSIEVRVYEDGDTSPQVVLNVTGVDTKEGATATWDGFDLGAGCAGTTDWANVIVMDGSGASMNNFIGPADVWALFANARTTPALTDWSLSIGADVAALVGDATPDDDSTYLEETTQNQQMTVAVDTVPYPGRTILGAQLYASVKLTSGSPTLKAIGYESAVANLGATFSPTAAYTYLMEPYSAMPSGASFSTAAFDALQWGLKLTSNATGARVTQIVVALIQSRDVGGRNLVTGYSHTVSGDDNVATGQGNTVIGAMSQAHGAGATVIGDRSTLFNLDGVPRTLTGHGKFYVYGEIGGDLAAAIGAMARIEEQTPSGTGVVTFSNLGAYTHLRIVWSARGTQVANATLFTVGFNGDTSAIYDRQNIAAAATAVSATESLAQTAVNQVGIVSAASATAGACGAGEFIIHDYRGTTFWKRLTGTYGWQESTASGGVFTRVVSGSYRSTSPITSIAITLASGNFVAGSKFSLYGIN